MLKPNETHFVGTITQKALVEKDGKFLFIQYPADSLMHPDKRAWGKWDMPGGRLSVGEKPLEGIEREVLEETGLEVNIGKILATGTFVNYSNKPNFLVVYGATLKSTNKEIVFEDGEAWKSGWFTPEEIFELPIIYPEYKEALQSILV